MRDYTYVDDIVDGFIAAMAPQQERFQVFNLGTSRAVSLDYLIGLIEEALGKKAKIRREEPAPGDVPITLADISKAATLLGYQPKVNIEEGISRFVHWYRKNMRVTA